MDKAVLTVYWQPGCSSCLKLKEHLTAHGIEFRSVNVLEDSEGFAELASFGLRRVPILARGTEWCDGQVLSEIDALAGINRKKSAALSPEQISAIIQRTMQTLCSYVQQIPAEKFTDTLPGRPRSYAGLACHIAEIVSLFLAVVKDNHKLVFSDYDHPLPTQYSTPQSLLSFCNQVSESFKDWATNDLPRTDLNQHAELYYGEHSMCDFLERTGWHSGQHLRQLELVLREKIGRNPVPPLDPNMFAGLPIPDAVWDDRLVF